MSVPTKCFIPAEISLPDFTRLDGSRWSCVACDQYTSQPEYWATADAAIGDSPSTLRVILPEVYLDESEARIPQIQRTMEDYLRTVLVRHPDSMILVERTLGDGKVRRGLVGAVDLETYDYRPGATSLIRATEQTVPERIPPRMTIRQDAALELPHVMLLIDDRARTVIEPLAARTEHGGVAYDHDLMPGAARTVIEPLAARTEHGGVAYDHDLMLGGGHIRGFWLTPAEQNMAMAALDALVTPEEMTARYGKAGLSPLLFAVGDGNHSLAAAKACYEALRARVGDEVARVHPMRYALCEVVNLYDDSLEFEPIYRVVFGVEPEDVIRSFSAYAASLDGEAAPQAVQWMHGDRHGECTVPHPVSALAVGTVQQFLDDYLRTSAPAGAYVDYIHGEDTAAALAARPHTVAFLYDGMAKEELFSTVITDGSLPRKTFSMGHAADKRFYTEARRLK